MFNKFDIETLESNLLRDLPAFAPELLLCVGIVGMLMLRLFGVRAHMRSLALVICGIGFIYSLLQILIEPGVFGDNPAIKFEALRMTEYGLQDKVFGGMLALDRLTGYIRLILFGFGALLIWLTALTGIPDQDDSADFYVLLLGGLLGMSLMAAANHLLIVFIAVEMASLPSYALSGFLKGRRQSSEAALKYVVYGGGASGVMLYGISLIAGRFGTGYLPQVAEAIRLQLTTGAAGTLGLDSVVLLGLVLVLAGLGFKLSAVPFHFWCPDVFEGASAEVGAFLSVASKAAAMALTARLLLVLAGAGTLPVLAVVRTFGPAIAFFAALTATFGNLAAYGQTNLKRLLAYSTIAHAGYMMMGLAPMTYEGLAAVLFYLAAYVFMNLGAFAIIALLRNKTGSEDLRDFRGLIYRSPLLVCLLAVFLLSLLGMPPLVGFAAKFQVFSALFRAGQSYSQTSPTLGYTMYALLVIGGINTVFSVFYYLKVLKVMVLEKPVEEMEGRAAVPIQLAPPAAVYASLLGAMVFVGGVAWNPLAGASNHGAADFQTLTGPPIPVGPPVIRTGLAPPRLNAPPRAEPKGQPPGLPKEKS